MRMNHQELPMDLLALDLLGLELTCASAREVRGPAGIIRPSLRSRPALGQRQLGLVVCHATIPRQPGTSHWVHIQWR